MSEINCPECGTERGDMGRVCHACGAPPGGVEHRQGDEEPIGGVRQTDLEPYVGLRYVARLFKVLAVLMLVMLAGEVVTGLATEGRAAVLPLLGAATRLLVLAGLLWAGGDIMTLLIDGGHDLRVTRILLGRINAQLHQNGAPQLPEVKLDAAQRENQPREVLRG